MTPGVYGNIRDYDEAYDLYLRCLAKDMESEALFNLDKAIDYAHPHLLPALATKRAALSKALAPKPWLERTWNRMFPKPKEDRYGPQ